MNGVKEVQPSAQEVQSARETVLTLAKNCVCGRRVDDYGKPENSFQLVANLWSAYKGTEFSAKDVTMMMALLKIARIAGGKGSLDSYVDLAGYAACGGELFYYQTLGEQHE